MLLAALLLAAQPEQPVTAAPRVQRIAQVSVQIIAAEEIRFDEKNVRHRGDEKLVRQQRVRGSMPMIEFY